MSPPNRVNGSNSSMTYPSNNGSPLILFQSSTIQSSTSKIIDIINEQCALATSRAHAETRAALDALNNLQREHNTFRQNVISVTSQYEQRAAALHLERDHLRAECDQVRKANEAASNGLRMVKSKIERYNEELTKRGITNLRIQIPDNMGDTGEGNIPEGELSLYRKRCEELQKQNTLLFLQVSTAEQQRVASEKLHMQRIAELEHLLGER